MANVLILGGGFGGVVAAEHLAKALPTEHQITLVSRSRRFTFYPALVRLAFGKCEVEDISYDLCDAMLDRRVRFIEAEVAHVDPHARKASLHGGDIVAEIEGRTPDVKYDHEIMLVVDEGSKDSVFLHKKLWESDETERNPTLTPALNKTEIGAWKRLGNIVIYRVRPDAIYGRTTL